MISNSLIELDRRHLVHPVTAYREHEKRGATVLTSASGIHVQDSTGKRYLDGFAGLWCVNAGYGQQSIVDAAAKQMAELPYATGYFGFSNEPAILLASQLAELAPGTLNHVYFALGGSDSVDSAVRFTQYYCNAIGKPEKRHFISLEMGYHGSSTTGAGLTALPAFHAGFNVPLPNQHKIPSHYSYRNPVGEDPQAIIAASVQALRDKVTALGGPDHVAAFICEPVQGSGGVLVPPKGWLPAMQAACRELDILFIIDEVITGFGRIGPLFGSEVESLEPDLMTVAKGLTSGYAPMGAVFLSDRIYDTIADHAGKNAVGHGFTYSAHPVSAAVGLATLRLYTEGGLLESGQHAGARLMSRLAELAGHPLVGEVRGISMLAGIEVVASKETRELFAPDVAIGARLATASLDNGVIFRAFANGTIGLAPSLNYTPDDIDELVARVKKSLDDVLEQPEVRSALVS
ncbi:adenosylmethionine-8-amino-7-oxononanoate aminotransferase [Pseudochelatococcus lubricantis]|uniref:Adenosylmethionine-8-amino-7-oxononanoate aminotransferase n=1 Tax=Pseudochelatococcus lubricantis TaxID=1538102 RepID=A0ABX0V1K8_9HYPH|nr:aminotransferase class III-fold pyridoxal phosphate-dependent enzyme [Pseudochelatococcus lubricantis]NIJ57999.1 adenosylmethionine-8-amino-7-oxononanoate aminotransferase [Pseudochelatococcus lubricantis]